MFYQKSLLEKCNFEKWQKRSLDNLGYYRFGFGLGDLIFVLLFQVKIKIVALTVL